VSNRSQIRTESLAKADNSSKMNLGPHWALLVEEGNGWVFDYKLNSRNDLEPHKRPWDEKIKTNYHENPKLLDWLSVQCFTN